MSSPVIQCKARDLEEHCEREEKDFHQFLMEREKINYFWIVEKKTFSEKQAQLRNKEREYQDLEERQQIELKMFQQRLKHLRYHQLDEIVEMKTEAELALKLQEDQHRIGEAEIKKDKRALKVDMKEAEVAQEDFIRMLKLEQDRKILELRQEFDLRARDMQQKYELRMKTIRDDMDGTPAGHHRLNPPCRVTDAQRAPHENVSIPSFQHVTDCTLHRHCTLTSFNIVPSLFLVFFPVCPQTDTAQLHKTQSDLCMRTPQGLLSTIVFSEKRVLS